MLSEETDSLKATLADLKIHLKPVMYKMDVRPLLKAVMDQFFGPATGLVDMIVECVPNPIEGSPSKVNISLYTTVLLLIDAYKVERTYTGPLTSSVANSMKACDPEGPVMVHVTKLYHTTDAQSFRALGRVFSGTVRKGMSIKVLGEGYSPEDEEDMMKVTVEDIWLGESR